MRILSAGRKVVQETFSRRHLHFPEDDQSAGGLTWRVPAKERTWKASKRQETPPLDIMPSIPRQSTPLFKGFATVMPVLRSARETSLAPDTCANTRPWLMF